MYHGLRTTTEENIGPKELSVQLHSAWRLNCLFFLKTVDPDKRVTLLESQHL